MKGTTMNGTNGMNGTALNVVSKTYDNKPPLAALYIISK